MIALNAIAVFGASASIASSSSTGSPCRYSRKVVTSQSSPSIRRPSADFWVPWIASSDGSSARQVVGPPSRNFSPLAPPARGDEMEMFLELVPPRMRRELARHGELGELIEVVFDLGRKPLARFPNGDWVISQTPVSAEDLRHAISKVGDFSEDNRSGINHSLHRISAIRNRKMQIIGLTCRVGRAMRGSAEMIRDLVENGGSILVIGPPGVGKTTLIREIARILADEHKKRVVIVDTSNEIGGDGDIPHSGIGRARRMQVPSISMQHNVMIEAVENHMPEVIVIDEIGTELEAMAASTIAQRGVQLVGTAHGVTIESIIKNPSLQMLVGGIESVTLGDDEARKRKVQKTILERKGPSTFNCAIELISKNECRVHHKLEDTVDAILAGKTSSFELRKVDENKRRRALKVSEEDKEEAPSCLENMGSKFIPRDDDKDASLILSGKENCNGLAGKKCPLRVYTYQISEYDLLQVATVMGFEDEIDVTDDIETASVILALSSELKQNPWIRSVAKFHGLPVFVIKENTMAQIVKAVKMILGTDKFSSRLNLPYDEMKDAIEIEDDAPKRKPSLEEIDALEEARLAIEYIVIPGGEPVELLPRCSEIIARQLELVASYQLAAETSGTEVSSRLQILPTKVCKRDSCAKAAGSHSSNKPSHPRSMIRGIAGSSVSRLPLLPE